MRPIGDFSSGLAQLENWYEYQVLAWRPVASTCEASSATSSTRTYLDGKVYVGVGQCVTGADHISLTIFSRKDLVLDTHGNVHSILSNGLGASPEEHRKVPWVT